MKEYKLNVVITTEDKIDCSVDMDNLTTYLDTMRYYVGVLDVSYVTAVSDGEEAQ